MPHHHAVRSRPSRLAFLSHLEARVLWDTVLREVPDPLALCLMPDHLHLLHARDVGAALGIALRSYARWRNNRMGVRGSLWRRPGPPEPVKGRTKLRRSERYIHLNPCRAGLVGDPLAWPWSTHRDRVGLALPAARPADPDPLAYHQYVSADPSVNLRGTDLPVGTDGADGDTVLDAVLALTRSPREALTRRGPVRSLALRSLRQFTTLSGREIGAELQLARATVHRVPLKHTRATRLVSRVLGDDRFPALEPGDLRRTSRWFAYRDRT